MGNYKFRLSAMMPNAWFYKLRDMNKPKTKQTKKILPSQNQIPQKHYYHTTENLYDSPKNIKSFDTRFPFDLPRKSTKNRTRRKTIYKPSPKKTTHSISTNCVCKEPEYPVWLKPKTVHVRDIFDDFPSSPGQDFLEAPLSEFECSDYLYLHHGSLDEVNDESWSSSFMSSSDIIFDMGDTTKVKIPSELELISGLGLKPIVTKPVKVKTEEESLYLKKNSSTKTDKETIIRQTKNSKTSSSPAIRKSVSCSRRVKVKGSTKSKVASKKRETRAHKSMKEEDEGKLYTESFVIVKSSLDPEHDFKESMMEMIVENNIKASKELEELLACYLSLNSDQYHDLIIKAFEQIWFCIPQQNL